MTANRNLLRMKFARVIERYAAEQGCSLEEALDRFYRSDVYRFMRDGVSEMHCMSDAYLAKELEDEWSQNTITLQTDGIRYSSRPQQFRLAIETRTGHKGTTATNGAAKKGVAKSKAKVATKGKRKKSVKAKYV